MSEKNPAQEYFQTKEAAREERKKKEIDLWQHWKSNGMKPEHAEPLFKLYEPVFAQKVRAWKAPRIPESAFRLKLQEAMITSMKTYDPSKSALNTHIENGLKKVHRYNARGQNLAYIPEGQIEGIAPINKAIDVLTEEFG